MLPTVQQSALCADLDTFVGQELTVASTQIELASISSTLVGCGEPPASVRMFDESRLDGMMHWRYPQGDVNWCNAVTEGTLALTCSGSSVTLRPASANELQLVMGEIVVPAPGAVEDSIIEQAQTTLGCVGQPFALTCAPAKPGRVDTLTGTLVKDAGGEFALEVVRASLAP